MTANGKAATHNGSRRVIQNQVQAVLRISLIAGDLAWHMELKNAAPANCQFSFTSRCPHEECFRIMACAARVKTGWQDPFKTATTVSHKIYFMIAAQTQQSRGTE